MPRRGSLRRGARDVPLHEVPRQLRDTLREQWLVITTIVAVGAAAFAIAMWLLPIGNLGGWLLNLSADMLGAVVIFMALERGIRSINSINVVPALPVGRFLQEVRTQGKIVRILETWTNLVNDDANYILFVEAVGEALQNNATVQVLIVHPGSSAAGQRVQQLAGTTDGAREIATTVRRFYAMLALAPGLEVRLYDALPSITVHQCNRIAYVSLFPISKLSSQHDLLEVEMFSRFGLFIEQSFDELWRGSPHSPTIPIQEHMALLLDSGAEAYFAFDDAGGPNGRRTGYIGGTLLWDHLLDEGQLRDQISFSCDGARFGAKLRVPSPEEIEMGRRLIQLRYEWASQQAVANLSIVARLDHIEEIAVERPDQPRARS
jgi:hypothetical protein